MRAWLDRLDAAARTGRGRGARLTIIGANPGRRAPELAAELGRETPDFKKDVRKLKEKGLTQSLDIGYLLSPRGAAVLGDRADQRLQPAPGPRCRRSAHRRRAPSPPPAITTLETWPRAPRPEVAGLHGVGPFALGRLAEALDAAGLAYAG